MAIVLKRILSLLLALVLAASLAACSSGDNGSGEAASDNKHELYIRDDFSDEVSARFLSTQSDDEETVNAEFVADGDGYKTFKCSADASKYDRVVITSNGNDSIELAFNEYVSGWHISPYGAEPFVYDREEPETHEIFTKEFKYDDPAGDFVKKVYVWTPSDYDAKSKEKYSVIYMTDGQNLFDRTATSYGSWGVCESVEAYMSLGGRKTIVVGIDDSTVNRDSELTPNIGKATDSGYDNGTGKEFSKFVVNKVMPFVNKNYNVYTDSAHTAICGSSSGGIESFFIGIDNNEKFGFIGALSPAFGLFEDEDWVKYLMNKDFAKNAPYIYIYCGIANDLESVLYPAAKAMPDNIKKARDSKSAVGTGIPDKNIVFRAYDEGMHNEAYWRAVFPEVLSFIETSK